MSATDLTSDTLSKINVSTIGPVLPEHTDSCGTNTDTVGSEIRLDHAEGSVDGPEKEEDNEQVVGVPEPLEVCATHLLNGCSHHRHERDEHDVARPAGTGNKVGKKPASKAQSILC